MKQLIAFAAAIFLLQNSRVQLFPVTERNGHSVQYRSEDTDGNYGFGYLEEHPSGGSYRREMGDTFGNKYGSYGLMDVDGRLRIVRYVADADGFRADIQSNEPTFETRVAADASINIRNKDPVVSYMANADAVKNSANNIKFRPQHLVSFGASYNEMLDL